MHLGWRGDDLRLGVDVPADGGLRAAAHDAAALPDSALPSPRPPRPSLYRGDKRRDCPPPFRPLGGVSLRLNMSSEEDETSSSSLVAACKKVDVSVVRLVRSYTEEAAGESSLLLSLMRSQKHPDRPQLRDSAASRNRQLLAPASYYTRAPSRALAPPRGRSTP